VTKAPDQKGTEAPTQSEAVAKQGKRITPALWMPAAPAIAWLAFSSAETDWDAKFYFGASIWYAADPERVLEWLHEVEEHGDLLDDFQPSDFQRLHRHVRDAAAQTASYQAAKAGLAGAKVNGLKPTPLAISDDHIREAARTLRLAIESKKADAQRAHVAIWEGSEKFCRALARGDLTAYGWPGRGPDFSGNNAQHPPRETIPRDVFSRPVTVTQDGVFAFARGDGTIGYDHEVLWSGLVFRVDEFYALGEARQHDQPAIGDTPPDRGGREAKHKWGPFDEECRQHLQKLLNEKPDSDPRRKLTRHMQKWAEDNMDPEPNERTVRGRAKQVFLAVTEAQPS
jgi:hypothetical protein